jgi:hypothetical protein
MLLCDGMVEGRQCTAGWHLNCLHTPLEAVPEGDWFCPCCRAQRGDAPIKPEPRAAVSPIKKEPGGTSGGRARGGAGRASGGGEVPIGIDPDSLEEEKNQDHCVCELCGFLMVEPTQSGCLQGNTPKPSTPNPQTLNLNP